MIKEIKKGNLYYELEIPKRGDYKYLLYKNNATSRALLCIGNAIFELEKYLKEKRCHKIDIAIDIDWPNRKTKKSLENCLENFISFVFLSETKVEIIKSPFLDDGYINNNIIKKADTVCLFSGGVDSISGILNQYKKDKKIISVFCSHGNQTRIISIVRSFQDVVLEKLNIDQLEVAVPDIDITGYSQSRGFLYILAASSVAYAYTVNDVVVSEVGPTMYQPKFSPADQVTMTTHPFVIERAKEINLLLNANIRIICPYENKTKAEAMLLCPDQKLIKMSHSCISQRLTSHDGTCYGCIIRRLASLSAGISDTKYAKNPIVDKKAKCGNLLSVLEFCEDILINKKRMPEYQRYLIDEYNKWDLFRRFSLDNFAAIYKLKKTRRLTVPVERIYNNVIQQSGGTNMLRNRLKVLKSIKTKV